MLKSSLCDYSDAYILVKGTITVLNNTQIDKAKDIGIVMPMYNLIGYSENYSKTSGSLWQYCKDIPAVNNRGNILEFNGANDTDSFNYIGKITVQAKDNGTK